MAPLQTLSTGQTMADIEGLLELYKLLTTRHGNSTNATGNGGMIPPALLDPNYKPHNLGNRDTALFLTPTLIAIIFMSIRLSVRWNFRTGVWNVLSEDWLLFLGFLCTVANGFMMTIGVQVDQFGMAIYDMKISSLQAGLKMTYAFQIIYIFAIAFIRLSLTLFIKRLYSRVSKVMRHVCDAFMVLTMIIAIGSACTLAFQCKPFNSQFDIFKKVIATCMGAHMFTAIAVINIVADVAVAALPMNLVWRMKALSRRKRIEVVIMFSLGLLACTAAIARFAFLSHTISSSNKAYYGKGSSINTGICCQWETCVAIVTACIPQAKIVITRFTSLDSTIAHSSVNKTPNLPSKPVTGMSNRFAEDKKMANASTISSNSDSIDYWTPQALELGKKDQAAFVAGLPLKGRTRSEEAEEIYSKLPTALPKTIPPWMVGAKDKDKAEADDEVWELHERRS